MVFLMFKKRLFLSRFIVLRYVLQGRNALKIDQKSFLKQHLGHIKTAFDNYCEDKVNQIGKASGFIKRQRKVSAFEFVNSLMFSVNPQANTSLPDMAADLNKSFKVDISKEALHKKFSPQTVTFLKELLKEQIGGQLNLSVDGHLNKHFSAIKVKDSTKFSVPSLYDGDYPSFNNFSRKNGVMNLQYEYDLISGKWSSLELTNIKNNDQQESKQTVHLLEKDVLHIRDLGYISPTYLKGVQQAGAGFLNRMPPQASIFDTKGNTLSWTEIDRKFKKTGVKNLDMDVEIYQGHRIKCRMVIISLGANESRTRLKQAINSAKSQKVGISKDHKTRCHYSVFITNIDKNLLPVESVMKTYQLRWQVELVFKTWKSFFSINKVKKVNKQRLECHLLAQFLWIILNWQLFRVCNQHVKRNDPEKGVSILKFFKRCNHFSHSLRAVVIRQINLRRWLLKEFLPLINNTLCETKGHKSTSYQYMNSFLTSLS